jgi:hypothetical protein
LAANYVESYTLRRYLEPPLEGVMDMFRGVPVSTNPVGTVAKTYDKLNEGILDTKDSNHHGYVMISKTDSRLIVLHHLSFYWGSQ